MAISPIYFTGSSLEKEREKGFPFVMDEMKECEKSLNAADSNQQFEESNLGASNDQTILRDDSGNSNQVNVSNNGYIRNDEEISPSVGTDTCIQQNYPTYYGNAVEQPTYQWSNINESVQPYSNINYNQNTQLNGVDTYNMLPCQPAYPTSQQNSQGYALYQNQQTNAYNGMLPAASSFNFTPGFLNSYFEEDDIKGFAKDCVKGNINLAYNNADRQNKAQISKQSYADKKQMDIETKDTKENLTHEVIEKDGELIYYSPETNKTSKVTCVRNINAELRVSNHPGCEPMICISGEDNGPLSCFISVDDFYDDKTFEKKLEESGFHLKVNNHNKIEKIREFRQYLSALYKNNVRTIPHHIFWNDLPDGSFTYVNPDEESYMSMKNPNESGDKSGVSDIWSYVKTDPFKYMKLVILLALNRVAYVLSLLFGTTDKSIWMLVGEGQKKHASSLLKGAVQITDSMDSEEIGNVLCSTFTGFAVYLYKDVNPTSKRIIQTISRVIGDGAWKGKKVSTIPLVISEITPPPELIDNFFSIVVNDDLSGVSIGDLVLSDEKMNELCREFPKLYGDLDLYEDYGYLCFAGIYAVRSIDSEHCTQDMVLELIEDMVQSDELKEGITGFKKDFVDAIYEYVEGDISMYNKDSVPDEFCIERDIIYDDGFLYANKKCFDAIIRLMKSDAGVDAIKRTLVAEKVLFPYGSVKYTSRCYFMYKGTKKPRTVYKIDRKALIDSAGRLDIITYKKIKGR